MIQNRRKFSKMRGKVIEAQKICTLAPILVFVLALFAMLSIFSSQAFADEEEFADLQASSTNYNTMYRLYNKYTGEHFYTANSNEKSNLVKVGWNDEGTGWYAPKSSKTPVYRLYNKYVTGGDHHYTTSTSERDTLIKAGWSDEGTGWYSDDNKEVPLYRQYNPFAQSGTHNYTTSTSERDNVVEAGWRNEGVGWYGKRVGVFTVYSEDDNSLSYYKRTSVPAVGSIFNGKKVTSIDTTFDETNEGLSYSTGLPEGVDWKSVKIVDFVDKISTKVVWNWFSGCEELTDVRNFSNLDTSEVTNFAGMFHGCKSLKNIDVSKLDVSNAKFLGNWVGYGYGYGGSGGMFIGCTSLTYLDVSNWDVSNVEDMGYLFCGCVNLKDLDVSKWNTKKAVDMRYMFRDCPKLVLDCSKWSVAKVEYHNGFNTNSPSVIAPKWVS